MRKYIRVKPLKIYKENEIKLFSIFNSIKQRCNSITHRFYNNYGLRGIKCEWVSKEEFYAYMIEGYEEGLVIDRKDNNGNYCKENCRWVTNIENQRNKRNNIIIEGVTLPEFCEKYNLNYTLTVNRYKLGWSIDKLKTFINRISTKTDIVSSANSKEYRKEYYNRYLKKTDTKYEKSNINLSSYSKEYCNEYQRIFYKRKRDNLKML